MKEPEGYEPPFVVCRDCGAYFGDMGRNVACEECGAVLPTGEHAWVTASGAPYPPEWAAYWRGR
jgi:hypothetical protein